MEGGEAGKVVVKNGTIVSHVWSPDSKAFACVVDTGSGNAVLQIVPAVFGGAASQTIKLGTTDAPFTRALRWVEGNKIYLQLHATNTFRLARVDLDRQTVDNVSASWHLDGSLQEVDVTPDGRRASYSVLQDRQQDVWVANLDGTSAERLTNDPFFERDPIWNAAGDAVIVDSNRGGQSDLWEIPVTRRPPTQLTSGDADNTPNSLSKDGSLITYERVSENAHLEVAEAGTTPRAITADTLSDFAPTLSSDGRTVAFQRHSAIASESNRFLDAQIMVGSLSGGSLKDAHSVGRGFNPRLSPDGRHVAFQQRHGNDQSRQRLIVADLVTSLTEVISDNCPIPGGIQSPLEWSLQNVVWSPSGDALYYTEWFGPKTAWTIHVYRPALPTERPVVVTLASGETAETARNLYPSPDGGRLAYASTLKTHSDSTTAEGLINVIDLSTGKVTTWARGEATWLLRGWRGDGAHLVLVRGVSQKGPNLQTTTEVREIDAAGLSRHIIDIDHAIVATARLDTGGGLLYVTRIDGDVPNLYVLSLANALRRPITHNSLPGVTFCGIAGGPAQSVVYVVDDSRHDIWLLRAKAKPPS
jgi:Tol biopolymer transport system component